MESQRQRKQRERQLARQEAKAARQLGHSSQLPAPPSQSQPSPPHPSQRPAAQSHPPHQTLLPPLPPVSVGLHAGPGLGPCPIAGTRRQSGDSFSSDLVMAGSPMARRSSTASEGLPQPVAWQPVGNQARFTGQGLDLTAANTSAATAAAAAGASVGLCEASGAALDASGGPSPSWQSAQFVSGAFGGGGGGGGGGSGGGGGGLGMAAFAQQQLQQQKQQGQGGHPPTGSGSAMGSTSGTLPPRAPPPGFAASSQPASVRTVTAPPPGFKGSVGAGVLASGPPRRSSPLPPRAPPFVAGDGEPPGDAAPLFTPGRERLRDNSDHISRGIVSSLFDDEGSAQPLAQLSAISTARRSSNYSMPGEHDTVTEVSPTSRQQGQHS